jgi:hypothetical protein
MATRQDTRRGSVGPIVFVMAFLAVLALGLSGWYAMTSGSTSHPARVITTGFPGPDASERNQQLQLARDKDPESTHGH